MSIRKKVEQIKGVTLVSLVVTIIVLLILAGVSLNIILGEDGILKKAKDATLKYEDASLEEIMDMHKLNGIMGDKVTLKDYLIENGIISQEEIEKEELIKLSNNIYAISTFKHLQYLSESVNKGEDYKGKTIYMLNDIDCKSKFNEETGEILEGENFVPIGTSNSTIEEENTVLGKKEFNGKLDGMGYKISNLYINKSKEGSYCTGLVGYLGEEGEIRNLNIESSYIQGYYETGAFAGRSRGKIINCTNESKVVGIYYLTGGIAGRNTNIIDNCTNKGFIYGGTTQTGGIVGNCDFSSNVMVSNCNNYGNVDATGSNIGGIVGGAYSSKEGYNVQIINSYNEGKIGNLELNTIVNVGGIIGRIVDLTDYETHHLKIKNCNNIGEIRGYSNVGGIAGNVDNGYISRCNNKGTVKGVYSLIGGINGEGDDIIISKCSNSGYVYLSDKGFYGVAGISGRINANKRNSLVEESFNKGEIHSLADMDKGRQIAGIVGNASGNDKYQVQINNSYNSGYIHGMGGISGIINYGIYCKITNSYNIGKLVSEDNVDKNGGIITFTNVENELNNNYWLNSCGANYGIYSINSNEGAESKKEEEFKKLATHLSDKYTDDINSLNNGYPILKWQMEN